VQIGGHVAVVGYSDHQGGVLQGVTDGYHRIADDGDSDRSQRFETGEQCHVGLRHSDRTSRQIELSG